MTDADMEQSPAALVDHVRKAFLYKRTFRQTADRVRQRFLAHTLQSVAHTQAQLLHIERLGDVIIGADFESLQTINPFALFREEYDGNLIRATVAANPPRDLISIDIRQPNIQNHQIREDGLRGAHTIFAPVNGEHFIALDTEISIQHFRNVKVVFNDQNLGFGFSH